MSESTQEIVVEETRQSRWERAEVTISLVEYEVAKQAGISQRQFAQKHGIARTSGSDRKYSPLPESITFSACGKHL